MSVVRVEPSELHWKKELTALRKAARLLRDPETSSSLRSPLSSKSAVAASRLNWVKGTRGNSSQASHAGGYPEFDSQFHLKGEDNPKKVSLYNWRHQPSKLSDSRVKLDGQEVSSVPESPNDSLSNAHEEDSKSDTYLENPLMVFRAREANLEKPMRRKVKKLQKRSGVSRQRLARNSKTLNLPSISSGEQLTPLEQSDDMGNCNSEDLQSLEHDLTRKSAYSSRSASPLLSKCENWSNSPKHLKTTRKGGSSVSYTPASTSSYNRYGLQNPSTLGSWDGTTASADEDLDPLDLPRRQGCGISCYWSKRSPKYRGWGGFHSPSLSDTLRRKGSSILCGSRTLYHKRRSSRSNKQKLVSKSAQGLQLLTYSCDGRGASSIDAEQSDDDLSTNFGELDLEALSRLDGQRWSLSCRSQDGLEMVALEGAKQCKPDHIRSLSQKYRPMFFHELIGQNIVVQSLSNSISRGRVAPVYLFHGARGTGKTSTARIFAAALNCLATEETKPCGFCRECTEFVSGKGRDPREVAATNKKGIDRMRYLMTTLSMAPPSSFSRYTVFIVDECHLLPSKTWSSFLKFLEEPPVHVVFIFITTDLDNLPRTVLSRCQKYLFNKIKDADILTRLKKLSANENFDVESHALDLIALNADGSLRDAETMLEQLSLLGKRITASLVNELVGVVSDEKLLDLLELAMSSDTAETVKRARELMDSGVDPMALMSQLAGLIMDIIAGTYCLVDSKCSGSFFGGRSLTEAEVERLKQALKLLSEAEKQLRVSSERQTWFTAALLQLGSVPSQDSTHSSGSRKQSSRTTEEDQTSTLREFSTHKKKRDPLPQKSTSSSAAMPRAFDGHSSPSCDQLSKVDNLIFDCNLSYSQFVEGNASVTTHDDIRAESSVFKHISPERLDDIWERCIDRCHSKTLRQLLREHGKLVSISKVTGVLIALIQFKDGDIKSRAERFLSSITNSIEIVLRHNVEVRIGLVPDREASVNTEKPSEFPNSSTFKEMEATKIKKEQERDFNNSIRCHSHLDPFQETHEPPKESLNGSESKLLSGVLEQSSYCPPILEDGNHRKHSTKEQKQDTPPQSIQTIIEEQRLESAWLKTAEKGSMESLNRFKPEKNQVLPQDDIYSQNQAASKLGGIPSQNWDAELNHELDDGRCYQKEQGGQRFDRYPMSPSLLHNGSFGGNLKKENLGYESGSSAGGCNGLLCWKTRKPHNRGEVKQGKAIRSQKGKESTGFRQNPKAKKTENRLKR
ncbi:DNA polymerase III [Macleaya cordata]|uniref:DNA polymerase III n=1 Tax=Macleaya cordata TaxID=56857 RepID=A0A200R8U0_MACCD|nr:DNA polymerase III [Macleaya cordata]